MNNYEKYDAITEVLTTKSSQEIIEEAARLGIDIHIMQQGKDRVRIYFPRHTDVLRLNLVNPVRIFSGK